MRSSAGQTQHHAGVRRAYGLDGQRTFRYEGGCSFPWKVWEEAAKANRFPMERVRYTKAKTWPFLVPMAARWRAAHAQTVSWRPGYPLANGNLWKGETVNPRCSA